MSTTYIEIAEVEFFTNVPKGYSPTDEEACSVATEVLGEFERRLSQSPFAEEVEIVRVEYSIGCIITSITLGVAVAGTAGGLAAFWAKYPKVRQGLILFLRDQHGFWSHLINPEKKVSTWLYSDEVFESGKIEEIKLKAEANNIQQSIPDKTPQRSPGRKRKAISGPTL